LRRRIGQKELQYFDEFGALDGIAANADSSRLAKPGDCRLEYRLIGQGARARDDSHGPGLENVRRHDADLAFSPRHDAWAGWTYQAGFRPAQRPLDLDHIGNWDSLRDADDELYFRVDCLANRVRRALRGNIDDACISASCALRLGDRVKDRQANVCRP